MAPKKAKLAEAEQSLNGTINILNAKRAELKEVEDRVESLKKQFAEMTEKKKQLEFQVRQLSHFPFFFSETSFKHGFCFQCDTSGYLIRFFRSFSISFCIERVLTLILLVQYCH